MQHWHSDNRFPFGTYAEIHAFLISLNFVVQISTSIEKHAREVPHLVHSVKAGPVPQASRDQLIAEWKSWIQEAGMLLSSVNVMADLCIWAIGICSGT